MRINPDRTANLLAMLSEAREQEVTALRQLSSGRRIQLASDDPAASAAVTLNTQTQSQQDQYLQSIASVRESLSTADSTLNSVVQSLERAVSLGVEGANGTLSADNRASLANEVQGIRDQILGLANSSFRGTYIFAGTVNDTVPFTADPAQPSGMRYDGNQQSNSVLIGDGRTISTGLPGDKLFADPSSNVFSALKQLADSLNANDPTAVADASGKVRAALAHVSNVRVTYGNNLNQLDSGEDFLHQAKLNSQARENSLVGADPADAIIQLRQAQFARDATLAAAARTQFTSLLDYLQ
jgi:flagellar hook-associated protein 3 FlgL